ncbi:hypothetical protein K437DRAFT_267101 [Tilletiaria anomala UBC 951]|uniref:Uncharacterized protein n=1 Tax=Tilletiaria anomala (strain ATCC 24038 / CBS 436.72 / UBC 951) TaxID=1037660 RepID=A0A066WLC6_TILAU|nr:uncharacterized protein K437DRAFT_267101 [Tilletiaria anomala UBC 951]KDN51435.1 hypothetical protein K437DRAFT_267101 [Tilletiaria anomala UBC 951]
MAFFYSSASKSTLLALLITYLLLLLASAPFVSTAPISPSGSKNVNINNGNVMNGFRSGPAQYSTAQTGGESVKDLNGNDSLVSKKKRDQAQDAAGDAIAQASPAPQAATNNGAMLSGTPAQNAAAYSIGVPAAPASTPVASSSTAPLAAPVPAQHAEAAPASDVWGNSSGAMGGANGQMLSGTATQNNAAYNEGVAAITAPSKTR